VGKSQKWVLVIQEVLLALKLFPNLKLALILLFLLLDSSAIALENWIEKDCFCRGGRWRLYNSTNLTTKEKITVSLNSL
jgi:hypothetical protein